MSSTPQTQIGYIRKGLSGDIWISLGMNNKIGFAGVMGQVGQGEETSVRGRAKEYRAKKAGFVGI